MMTTFAALLGALPLAFGHGAGAELRQPLGIAIVGGSYRLAGADVVHHASGLSVVRPYAACHAPPNGNRAPPIDDEPIDAPLN